MTTTAIRAGGLGREHLGKYWGKFRICGIDHRANDIVVSFNGQPFVERPAADEMVSLSYSRNTVPPTEPGSLIAATPKYGQRAIHIRGFDDEYPWVFADPNLADDTAGAIAVRSDVLSDPVELVAVPKKEWDNLKYSRETGSNNSIAEAAIYLILKTAELNEGLTR